MDISNLIEEMTTPIHDFLVKNSESHTIRCYMPGHKGTEDPLDITEIDGADSLYDTDTNGGKGIIAQSEKNASKLFGSKRTLYSCSGSTLAIQTMLTLAKLRGNGKDHVIAGRYSHRSFINSCVLLSSCSVPLSSRASNVAFESRGISQRRRYSRKHRGKNQFKNACGIYKFN